MEAGEVLRRIDKNEEKVRRPTFTLAFCSRVVSGAREGLLEIASWTS